MSFGRHHDDGVLWVLEHIVGRDDDRRSDEPGLATSRDFAGKDDLLTEVAHEGFVALAAAQADVTATGADRLSARTAAYVRFGCAHPTHYRFMFSTPPHQRTGRTAPALRHVALQTFATLADSVGDANPAVDSNDAARRALMIWSLAHGAVHPLEDWAETFAHYLHIDASVSLQRWIGRETITPTPCNAADTEATPMWFRRPAEVRGSVDSTRSAAPSAVAAGMLVRRCDHAENARNTRLDANEA